MMALEDSRLINKARVNAISIVNHNAERMKNKIVRDRRIRLCRTFHSEETINHYMGFKHKKKREI